MYNGPVRGGNRGGRDQFNWESVKSDKDRTYYIGHSVKASVGRWQKDKDLFWYTKTREGGANVLEDEIRAVKAREEDLMLEALGLKKASVVKGRGSGKLEKYEVEELLRKEEGGGGDGGGERVKGLGFRAGYVGGGERRDVLEGVGVGEWPRRGAEGVEGEVKGEGSREGMSKNMKMEQMDKMKKEKKEKKRKKKEKKEKKVKKEKSKERKRKREGSLGEAGVGRSKKKGRGDGGATSSEASSDGALDRSEGVGDRYGGLKSQSERGLDVAGNRGSPRAHHERHSESPLGALQARHQHRHVQTERHSRKSQPADVSADGRGSSPRRSEHDVERVRHNRKEENGHHGIRSRQERGRSPGRCKRHEHGTRRPSSRSSNPGSRQQKSPSHGVRHRSSPQGKYGGRSSRSPRHGRRHEHENGQLCSRSPSRGRRGGGGRSSPRGGHGSTARAEGQHRSRRRSVDSGISGDEHQGEHRSRSERDRR